MLALPLLTAVGTLLAGTARQADAVNVVGALATAGGALALAAIGVVRADDPAHGSWYVLDAAGGVFFAVIAVVGLLSALASPLQLAGQGRGLVPAARARGLYYFAFHAFWAALLAVPLVDNLALAWLLVEATTGASALLVAFSGKRSALEAGWKYLVLTTFGLAVALLGIILLYALAGPGGDLAALDWRSIAAAAPTLPAAGALTAFVLIITGLATKVGWAPVHNWLPDAHSEAPPAVSALLSAALLPAVVLVAWRVLATLGPALDPGAGSALFLGFGLLSLAIAVPFLWRALPWKRLLAYSSLEHMGVLAIGIGFATPLATAGVVAHVAGHALAKALGFYAADAAPAPRPRRPPAAASRARRGRPGVRRRGRRQPGGAGRAPAVAAVRQRAADPARRPRRRRDGRHDRRRRAAGARLPRAGARADRGARRRAAPAALAPRPQRAPDRAAHRGVRRRDARRHGAGVPAARVADRSSC